ncbi:dynein heavy chain, putative [Anopheles sinensis]|uniref:Dynein heavy chain, putative n=1 Tax=Anopheles sinensis TaxID=74873 RepID=A0A084W9M1_ANOSI|nr:dynein heavy chain, putative [Anopheles sinensis]
MAERLNTALAMSARGHNLTAPETQRRPGDPDTTEKDHREAAETLPAPSEPESGERRGDEDRSGADGDLC